jgi:hypothetical protein
MKRSHKKSVFAAHFFILKKILQSGYVFVHTIQLFTHKTFKTPTNCVGVLWAPGVKKSHKIPQIFQKSHPTLWVFKVPQIRVPRVGLSL